MANLGDLWQQCNSGSSAACQSFRELMRDILQSAYLVRYFRPRIPPLPDPYPRFDPTPTPVIEQLANHQFLIEQLVLDAVGDPSPQPNIFSYVRDQQLHLEAAKQLHEQFQRAADEMRDIVEKAG